MARSTATYHYQINDYSIPTGWSTGTLFDASYREPTRSPIDAFVGKLQELNVMILDPRGLRGRFDTLQTSGRIDAAIHTDLVGALTDTTNLPPVHANLVLLGYISAVESFFRELIRRIIVLDAEARKACENKTIAYGAAISHNEEMLPEALLEQLTFISAHNITTALKDFIGIKGACPAAVNEVLVEYENVCQLRHCIVHRFSKLGATNAIRLGLDSHKNFIEKPIRFDYSALQKAGAVCSNVAKEINQFLWEYVMMRQIADNNNGQWKKRTAGLAWTWNYPNDRPRFKKYFDIFALRTSSGHSVNLATAYRDYRAIYASLT